MIFRFDDVCINCDIDNHNKITDYLLDKFNCQVLWAISPFVHTSQKPLERVFPRKWNALSDYRKFYELDKIGIPEIHPGVARGSHGLIHVDHRLLTKEAQEVSVLTSASITKSQIFVPPFNKWNCDTEMICSLNCIELIKFEDGWKCMEYEDWDNEDGMWYLHAREWDLEKVKAWFGD